MGIEWRRHGNSKVIKNENGKGRKKENCRHGKKGNGTEG
jgi:hypothetical protein